MKFMTPYTVLNVPFTENLSKVTATVYKLSARKKRRGQRKNLIATWIQTASKKTVNRANRS